MDNNKGKVKISEIEKDVWRQEIKTIIEMINNIDKVPKNILEYESDMIMKGIEILPTGENKMFSFIM
jgi:GTP-dependent phosphoenolpyruvate carboxykinase